MTNYEYRKKALVFERPGMTQIERLNHAVLGLVSEMAEFQDALTSHAGMTHVMEEAGDILWFTALAEDAVNLPDVPTPVSVFKYPGFTVGLLADAVKATLIYGRPLPMNIASIAQHVSYTVYRCTREFFEPHGVTIEALQLANLRKLAARYKAGKFSFDNANMRNVAAEYAAMEGGE